MIGVESNLPVVLSQNMGGPLAPCAVGIIIHIRAVELAAHGFPRRVGMQRQMQIVISRVRLADHIGEALPDFAAGKTDGVCTEHRLHGVGHLVHVLLLVAAAHILVKRLQGRTQKNNRHGFASPSPFHSGLPAAGEWKRRGTPLTAAGKRKTPRWNNPADEACDQSQTEIPGPV